MDSSTISLNDTIMELTLLESRPDVAIPYIVILALASVAGTIGNLLVICTIATRSLSRMVGTEFFLNLAISDIIITAIINPFAILGVTEGRVFYGDDNYWLCKSLASVCIISCFSSLGSIVCISISRYIYVCHNNIYSRIYTRRNNLLICAATWILGFVLDLPSHLGWSRHFFDEKAHKCLWDRNYQYSYSVFFVVIGILFMIFVAGTVAVFYTRICLHIGRAKQQLQSTAKGHSNVFSSTMKQAKIMMLIYVAFGVCWTPYMVILLLDRQDSYPMEAYLFSSLAAHVHASLNFILYGFSNQKFREGYRKFLGRYCTLLCFSESENPTVVRSGWSCSCSKHRLCCFDKSLDLSSPEGTVPTDSEYNLDDITEYVTEAKMANNIVSAL